MDSWKEISSLNSKILLYYRSMLAFLNVFINDIDIMGFYNGLDWLPMKILYLIFLLFDDVGFDNRDMFGYIMRGYVSKRNRIVQHGEFTNNKICSLQFFRGINRVGEVFCRQFTLNNKVSLYPRANSIWILDGASIHVMKRLLIS